MHAAQIEPDRQLKRPSSAMAENSDLEKRLDDLERRHNKTREWLIGFVSIAVAASLVILLNPERAPDWTHALALVVAYFVIRYVTRRVIER
jgi:hypothetical protein